MRTLPKYCHADTIKLGRVRALKRFALFYHVLCARSGAAGSLGPNKKPPHREEKKSLQGVELSHIRAGNFIPGFSPKALKHFI